MKNTFTGAILEFPNRGVHALIAEIITFRKQLTVRKEFQSQSGWDDSLNLWMQKWLERLAATVKRITYSPSATDPTATATKAIADAKNTATTLKDAFDGKSINSDDIVMASTNYAGQLPYDFTGSDKNLPQPTPQAIPNDFGRLMIAGLDNLVVQATNVDSRALPSTLNAAEAAQLLALLNELYVVTQTKGGEANRMPIPTGLLPAEQASTFNASGQHDPVTPVGEAKA